MKKTSNNRTYSGAPNARREIIYRGKCIGNGQWLIGTLIKAFGDFYIYPSDAKDSYDNYQVDPATIGQYTGINDMYGNRIFEGDIIKAYGRKFAMRYLNQVLYVTAHEDSVLNLIQTCKTSEIVGNIYDNQ